MPLDDAGGGDDNVGINDGGWGYFQWEKYHYEYELTNNEQQ